MRLYLPLVLLLALFLNGCSLISGPAYLDPATDPREFIEAPDVKWRVAGRTVENRPIYYTTFGRGKDVTLLFGCFHGSERSSPHLPLFMADLLSKEPELLEKGHKVVIVPFQNPDGYAKSTRRNANNVDLNRNYPTENWGQQPKPTPSGRKRTVYFGPSPASEPETKTVLKLMKKYDPDKIISIHQPLACNNNDGPNGLPLAELMAEYNQYPVKPYIGFPTPGSYGTYAGKELGIPMVTLELPPGSPSDTARLDQFWKENREALLAVFHYDVSSEAPVAETPASSPTSKPVTTDAPETSK